MSRLAQSSPKTDAYLADFERFAVRTANEPVPAWLMDLRRRGIERFSDAGFPTARDEEWRFTSVAPIADRRFSLAQDGQGGLTDGVESWTRGLGGYRLVMVNGRLAPELSGGEPPPGVLVASLASVFATSPDLLEPYLARLAAPDRQAFTALNTGFLQDGAFVWIPPGAVVDQPIVLLFVSASFGGDSVSHPRTLVVAGDGSQARVVESYVGGRGQEYFTNAVTEVVVGPGAVLDHCKLQRESRRAFHVAAMHVRLARDSSFSSHSIGFGGALVRNDVLALLDGEGGDCTLNGLYLSDGRRLVDNHTTIDHAKPHCGSHELYKGILSGHARAVFNGKIVVRQDAQKTDAKQTNKALLLSDDAQINSKPQLEIFANDVKCTHGAAVGQLDDDAIFYLRSRGLDLLQARNALIRAFAGDVLSRVRIGQLGTLLEEQLLAELPEGTGAERPGAPSEGPTAGVPGPAAPVQ
jgi:Fe-S cluster assembly protein SufD